MGIDVTDQRAREAALHHRALHDGLTGLLNREGLLEQLHKELARQRRRGGRLAVHMLDLDRFKAVNDAHGHPTGDALLRAVGARLRDTVRAEDSVARLSGDEFAVLQVDPDEGQPAALAGRLVAQVALPFQVGGLLLSVGTSVGLATSEAGRGPADSLLAEADAALYRAKRGGRGRFAMHDERLAAAHARRVSQLGELDAALRGGGIPLRWQPLVPLRGGAVAGLEALARWPGPSRPSTVKLIELAVSAGRIDGVGLAVRGAALRQATAWRADGLAVPPISLNLSAAELADRGLNDRFQGIWAALDWPTERIELDLPPAVWGSLTSAGSLLRALAGQGVRLALDDVGLGVLPIEVLRSLPIARVKLHQRFVRERAGDALGRAVVDGLVGLAHAAGAEVVAEGVETAAQAAWLLERGCDLAQGHHFGPPCQAGQVPAQLAARPPDAGAPG